MSSLIERLPEAIRIIPDGLDDIQKKVHASFIEGLSLNANAAILLKQKSTAFLMNWILDRKISDRGTDCENSIFYKCDSLEKEMQRSTKNIVRTLKGFKEGMDVNACEFTPSTDRLMRSLSEQDHENITNDLAEKYKLESILLLEEKSALVGTNRRTESMTKARQERYASLKRAVVGQPDLVAEANNQIKIACVSQKALKSLEENPTAIPKGELAQIVRFSIIYATDGHGVDDHMELQKSLGLAEKSFYKHEFNDQKCSNSSHISDMTEVATMNFASIVITAVSAGGVDKIDVADTRVVS